ncbi:MAG: potassium transporter TrkG [Desulfofustis sp.]
MLVKYVGQLCIALAVLSCVPLLVSIVCKDFTVSGRYAVIIAALLLFGLVCGRLRISMKMQHNEAMAVTALIFLITPLVMAWPTMAAGLDFFDALFETVSAVTTTGLSTVVSLEGQTKTFLFSRAWMQWVGGLGIVVLGMAALIQPGLAAKRLDIAEFSDDIIGGTRAVAQRVLTVYVLLTIGGIGLLMLSGVDWYNALLYCLSAISTGGFSPHDASLAGLQNFPLWRDEQLKALLMISIVVSLVLALSLKLPDGLGGTEAFRHGAVNGLSALSTAGFSSMDIGAMEPGSKFILMLAMALGGSAGSTAGGIKIIRLLILFQLISLMIRRSAAPAHAIDETRLGQRKLDQQTLISTAMFVVIFIGCAALSWLPFLLLGQQPLDSLFEVFSALGTAGLSSGITAQDLQPLLKAVLCADMLLGRLEIIVWLVFFYPGTWIGLRKEK